MKKAFAISILSWIIISLTTIATAVECDPEQALVRAVFDKYTISIKAADIISTFETISNSPDIRFITPTGEIIEGNDAYKKYHEEWFAQKGWSIEFSEPKITILNDTALTFSRFIYNEKKIDNRIETLESWFTLIYGKENGSWKIKADICTPISLRISEPGSSVSYDMKQDFFFEVLKSRRTIRKFKSDPVPKEHIIKIIDAARLAPTSGNQQPWKFLVVTDRKKLDELTEVSAGWIKKMLKEKYNYDDTKAAELGEKYKKIIADNLSAPVLIIILVDSKAPYPEYIHTDGDLATENLITAARALGYGTGYYTSFFPEEIIKPFFKIPDEYKLICVTPIGVPENWPSAPPKKELKDIVIYESF